MEMIRNDLPYLATAIPRSRSCENSGEQCTRGDAAKTLNKVKGSNATNKDSEKESAQKIAPEMSSTCDVVFSLRYVLFGFSLHGSRG